MSRPWDKIKLPRRLARAGLLVAALATAMPAAAAGKGKATAKMPYTLAGNVEFGLTGLLDLDPFDPTAVYADLRLGYFLINDLEIGLTVLEGTRPSGERGTFGLFGEYDFPNILPVLIPFAGGALRHTAPPSDAATGPDGRVIAVNGGLSLPMNSSTALSATFELELADHAVLGWVGHHKTFGREVSLALRLFL